MTTQMHIERHEGGKGGGEGRDGEGRKGGSWDVCWLLVVVAVNVVVVVVLKVSDGICFDTAIIRREIVWKQ